MDPDANTSVFMPGTTKIWGSFEDATEYIDEEGQHIYGKMIEEAQAEVLDVERRFESFSHLGVQILAECCIKRHGCLRNA